MIIQAAGMKNSCARKKHASVPKRGRKGYNMATHRNNNVDQPPCMHACMHGCMDAWLAGWMYGWMSVRTYVRTYVIVCVHVCMCVYVCNNVYIIYMVTRSAAPPLSPPPWSMVQDAPPLLWDECGFPLPPVGWLWGFWGFGSSLSFRVLGLGSWVKRYKASSRQGLREGLGCRFVRVDSLCLVSA